jgi:hypothetical protein
MDNKGKPKLLTSDKINISVQVDAHIGTHVKQASRLRLLVPTLIPTVNKLKEVSSNMDLSPSS